MNSFVNDIRYQFRQGNTVTRLILINLSVFIAVNLLKVVFFLFAAPDGLFNEIIRYVAVPSGFSALLVKPWTPFSYMFLHEGIWHLFFNMLVLYWGGRIFTDFLGSRKLVWTYILGGISGAVLFVLAYNIFPVFNDVKEQSVALGASASVLAIMIAVATYIPNYNVYLLLIGPVRLKYIAVFMVLIDLVGIESSNPGGHIAHLGGALFGFLFIRQYKAGHDITQFFDNLRVFLRKRFIPSKKKKYEYQFNSPKGDLDTSPFRGPGGEKVKMQDRIDTILDKISQSGYESLTKTEKEILFHYSKNN